MKNIAYFILIACVNICYGNSEELPNNVYYYTNISCDACLKFEKTDLKSLKEAMAVNPSLNLKIVEIFNLSNSISIDKAIALECSKKDDKYWEVKKAFININNKVNISSKSLFEEANKIYDDGLKLSDCYNSDAILRKVSDEYYDAKVLGVKGYPAFRIGNQQVILYGKTGFKKLLGMLNRQNLNNI